MQFKLLSQQDPRWGLVFLGTSKLLIKTDGCTLTALAMALNITPDVLNQMLIKGGAFYKDSLIWWTKLKDATNGALEFIWRGNGWDESKVDKAISDYGFVLAEVDFDGNIKTTGRHWLLLKGNQKANDPINGTEIKTSKYNLYTGYAILKVDRNKLQINENPNMSEYNWQGLDPNNKESMAEAVRVWAEVRDGKYKKTSEVNEMIQKAVKEETDSLRSKLNVEHEKELDNSINFRNRELARALEMGEGEEFESMIDRVKSLVHQSKQEKPQNGNDIAELPVSNSTNYKKWYESKTIWFNIVMTFINFSAFITTMTEQLPQEVIIYAVMVQGLGNIILRTWFTQTKITDN